MMDKRNKKRCQFSLTGGIFLLLVLCWLSVCLPFQYQSQQQKDQFQSEEQNGNCGILLEDLDEKAPFTTEEYLPNGLANLLNQEVLSYYADNGAVIVNACHGELFSPPPNKA